MPGGIMKTIIYYFTGTGNSLAAAREIATVLGDCELVPVGALKNSKSVIVPNREGNNYLFIDTHAKYFNWRTIFNDPNRYWYWDPTTGARGVPPDHRK